MSMYDLIQKKKEGLELSREEIEYFIREYTAGNLPDYQASALTMAICFRGMTDREMTDLTLAMRDSGDKADLSCFGGRAVDKHSTGGVGDKTSLIVGPLVASLGCKLAKMSGRGLGHTGGTVDKLESIPGFCTSLDPDAFRAQVERIGIAIVGQSGNFAPADKKLYALRDVTATVDSVPLIASSIMSKKLAAGADTIVLDVKCGSGAFMKTEEEARVLAEKMVMIGKNAGRNTSAVITDMDIPLGRAIGNALEVKEAYAVLAGRDEAPDLREVCLELASRMVGLCYGMSEADARAHCEDALKSGLALAKFREWISAQGGDVAVLDRPEDFCPARFVFEVKAPCSAYIEAMDAEEIGKASVRLGAGRVTKEDAIDFSAGICLLKKTGDFVREGEALCRLYSSVTDDFEASAGQILGALGFSEHEPGAKPLIYGIVC